MHNEKIFKELEGVFKWIEHRKKEKGKQSEFTQMDSYSQIKEFFNFLNLEATTEEIEALKELANADAHNQISYEDLYKVFVQDEKSLEQERKDLQNAFRVLSKDDQIVDLDKLEQQLGIYEKTYKQSVRNAFLIYQYINIRPL